MTACTTYPAGLGGAWDTLRRELDAWGRAGRVATLWWRDDDARTPGPRLDRLLALSAGLPLSLAVIPAGTGRALAERLLREPHIAVMQHGYDHRNHAATTEKSIELGPHRARGQVLYQLGVGHRRLAALFGRRFSGILAPPWNRIADTVAMGLDRTGTRGLSGFGAPRAGLAIPQINAHVDIMDWRGTRGFVGTNETIGAFVRHLALRRTGAAAGTIPSGLLTHHKDNDAAAWRFLEKLVDETRHHEAVRWVGVNEAMQTMEETRDLRA